MLRAVGRGRSRAMQVSSLGLGEAVEEACSPRQARVKLRRELCYHSASQRSVQHVLRQRHRGPARTGPAVRPASRPPALAPKEGTRSAPPPQSRSPRRPPQCNTRVLALLELRGVREAAARQREEEQREQAGKRAPGIARAAPALRRRPLTARGPAAPAALDGRRRAGDSRPARLRPSLRPSSAPHRRHVCSAVAAATAAAAANLATQQKPPVQATRRAVYRGEHSNATSSASRPRSAPPPHRGARHGGDTSGATSASQWPPMRFIRVCAETTAAEPQETSAAPRARPVPLRLSDLDASTREAHQWRRPSAGDVLQTQRPPQVHGPAAEPAAATMKSAQRRFNGRLACSVGVEADKDREAKQRKLYRPRFAKGLPATRELCSLTKVDTHMQWVVASARTLQQNMARRRETRQTWLDPAHGLT